MKFFTHPTHDGQPVNYAWIIAAAFGWQLQWSRRCKSTKIGWYFGSRGLRFALNLPVVGDFSLWSR
jgi:hypothetical protein